MIKEISAKVLLSRVPQPDTWFGLRYNMNLYRGCQHQCIYCDSRSECYQIENFADILIKSNAIELLRKELASKRIVGTVGTGSMNDPYMPLEGETNLTGRALGVISEFRFPVHVVTKSDLVVRDIDKLRDVARVFAAVSFTVTTADDDLAAVLEPNAPSPSARFAAMEMLAQAGIVTGVLMMPILPFIEDNEDNIGKIVARAHGSGASYVIPAFGMTLRDRQRDYYYSKLDLHFPGVRERYERRFGERYECAADGAARLEEVFRDQCSRLGVATRMPRYDDWRAEQTQLL